LPRRDFPEEILAGKWQDGNIRMAERGGTIPMLLPDNIANPAARRDG